MKIPILLTTIMLVVFSLAGSNNTSITSAGSFVEPAPMVLRSAAVPGAIRFTSGYTALTKCGSGMTKAEEKEADERGSDIPTRCKGYGGYDVYIYYSACSSHFSLEKGEENFPLATQAVDWKQKNVEWRLANGKPFAIIMRVYEYSGNDQCSSGGKITGESLMVKGLKGYEHIDGTINVRGTRNANAKARALADRGYSKEG